MERTNVKGFTSKEPREIILPLNKIQVDCLFHTDNNWQVTLAFYLGSIENHYPKDPFNIFLRYPMDIA